MDARTLLALSAGCAALAVFAGWRGAKPPNPLKGPRMIPWRWLMVVSATAAVLLFSLSEQAAGLRLPGR
ncbi:hypothetical protein [Phenylobacterium kunshanense]|uniref:Uncharacterized protein n=1 Tax=Phenylobacterium kunshanense TaxID=1445034 RepID=A0A328BDS4_9CAUL|nr:hypothetical protein [Phenylobacterium kunshanense]RAK64899.1 hypothetical protein DJ019_12885 [Phenylobacterium kunshanense]